MSARQNKKQRKGRNNANNRERTVTTLTEDPNTPYLVPTPSEEPAGGHMSAPFSAGPTNPKLHNVAMGAQPYQMPGNYGGFGYNGGSFGTPLAQQQPPFFSSTQSQSQPNMPAQQQSFPLPPGKNDLEILQNLKKMIIENQHPFFRAVPQPAALASLYKGPMTPNSQSQSQARRPEPGGADYRNDSGDGHAGAPPTSASSYTSSTPDTGRRQQRNQGKDRRNGPASAGGNQQSNNNNQGNRYNSSGGNNVSNKAGKGSGPPSAGPDSRSTDFPPPSDDLQGRYDYSNHARYQKPDFSATGNRGDYGHHNGVKTEPLDDPMDGIGLAYGSQDDLSRPGSWVPRQSGPYSENGPSDSDRTVTPRGGLPSLDARGPAGGPPADARDRDNDFRGRGWQDRNRRQSYERPNDARQGYGRRTASAADQQDPSLRPDDSHVPGDSNLPADRPPSPLPARIIDTRNARSISGRQSFETIEARPPNLPSLTPKDSPGPVMSPATAAVPPDNKSNLAVAQGRVNPPSRPSTDDVSVTPAPTGGQGPPPHPHPRPPHHDRPKKKFNKNQGGAGHGGGGPNSGPQYGGNNNNYDGPRGGYTRQPSPPSGPPPHSGRPFPPRSPSADGRGGRPPPSPNGGRGRDFRGPPDSGRDASRDRPVGYRPDYDPNASLRYADGRPYPRGYSPPPGDRGRPGAYSPPPTSGPAGGRNDWSYSGGPYPPGRRDWTAAEEEAYKSRGWESGPPPPERGYGREYSPRAASWDARPERDYPPRDPYPPGPPPPVDDRYADRSRPPPAAYPPYNRVRPRSPSPLRRSGTGPIDDRPPVKRARDEYHPVDPYYPPPGSSRDTPATRRPPGEYPLPPPRSGSPGPPTSGGSSWPPPPSSASSGGPQGAGPPDRDYRLGGYPPPASGGYDRPRSPGPPARGSYHNRGGYARDGGRGGYAPRP